MTVISIIVPCYNQAEYLDECLQSVLDQTYQNWECIIVNDGSPDNTEEVALQWTQKDARFIYIKKENGGVASARNLGIEKCKGEWILPLDGDDKIGNYYLEYASNNFNFDYDLIYCNAKFFGLIEINWDLADYAYDKMLISNMIFSSAFFKKEKFDESGGFDQKLIYGYEDWEFWISLLNQKSKVLRLDYVGFNYRRKEISRDTLVNESEQKKCMSYNYIYRKHLDKYLQLDNNAVVNYQLVNSRLNELSSLSYTISKNKLTRLLYKIIKQFS